MSQRKGSRNMLHLMFDPDGMRPFVERWDEIATSLIHRLRTEATGRVIDLKTRELLAALLAYSDVKIGSRAGGHRASQNRPEPRDEDHISFTFRRSEVTSRTSAGASIARRSSRSKPSPKRFRPNWRRWASILRSSLQSRKNLSGDFERAKAGPVIVKVARKHEFVRLSDIDEFSKRAFDGLSGAHG
jgi:MmyB-like transcription regulator ligand binding domain